MKAVVLRLKPHSRFHFGKYAPDSDTALNNSSEIMHSDTLFAAMINIYNSVFQDTNAFVRQFEECQIKISSVFYCMQQNGEMIWFLPKPLIFNLVETFDYKEFNKIEFISKKLWETLKNPIEIINNPDIIIIQKKYALLKSESTIPENVLSKVSLFNSVVFPKVHIRKPNQEGGLFQLNSIEIADNSEIDKSLHIHFYFLLKTTNQFDQEYGSKLDTLLKILADEGIGAERSTIGQVEGFQIVDNWEINFKEKTSDISNSALVSLYSPTKNELKALTFGKTILRGGRILGKKEDKNYFRLKTIRLATEGSIIKNSGAGQVVNITPEGWKGAPYKRNGIAFTLPISESWK